MILGIDVGSRTTKAVLWNGHEILAFRVESTGVNMKEKASQMIKEVLKGCGKVGKVVATGYGRQQVEASKRISEISCQARAIHFLFPRAKTVIDIGGQDSKVILLGPEGKVLDFIMNDKCAAGTGRFLEMMAGVLEIKLEDYGLLFDLGSKLSLWLINHLSTICIVNSNAVARQYQQYIDPSKLRVIYQSVSVPKDISEIGRAHV